MTGEEIVEKVKAGLPDALLDTALPQGDAVIFVAPDCLQKVATFLKDDPSLKFDYLSDVCGVDYLLEEREPRFEAVYLLYSIDHRHSVRIRVGIEEENPSVPTVSEIWKGALYPEQELFDMFGINVEGHPKMERLIMPKEWVGHPLRKDYPLTTETVAFSHNRDFKSELVKSKPPTR
ncbi:MAG: NADH-quinone oxidoreductase subunit C [Nitrospina sp.]|mgnify:FL=1|jgi:NADH-quinone oxidoreductase subunit C|nr:NADH-quinone oxidoreductase subunit C [Nitrospina sp.]MBT3509842.1 NADH-quinone oxidoreductase subunit C [Nitrospina sp.]MBT4047349.1 NADH-quinone oxidoreductase subunit C [Nitrospina sp.]MBT4558678.1 NADH-quinone oxidoreductase subunit C [Nitrospina sp.]MBT5347209.1 NADH-quinone oxidoreductase subunit C [Nitrospina sp.]